MPDEAAQSLCDPDPWYGRGSLFRLNRYGWRGFLTKALLHIVGVSFIFQISIRPVLGTAGATHIFKYFVR